MELKDGKIIITDEEKKILESNEGKKWLTDNKFMIVFSRRSQHTIF